MATRNEIIEGNKNCLKNAASDEPVFILRAADRLSPKTIEHWASLLEASGVVGVSDKVKEARAVAHDMRAWQERNYSKTPD